jgi:hypothetical protein
MRCFVRHVNGNYHAAFDWSGVSYTHSLRTRNDREAEVRLGPIRDTLYRLENGNLQIPAGADPKFFIVSGGQLTSKPKRSPGLTVGSLAQVFLGSRKVEPNTLKTLTFHFNHFKRLLGEQTPIASIRLPELQSYADKRSRETHHGKAIRPLTIRKEILSFRQGCIWAAEMGYAKSPPAWSLRSMAIEKDQGRDPFRTRSQIMQMIRRGALTQKQQAALWETLYLSSDELGKMLDYDRDRATQPFVSHGLLRRPHRLPSIGDA